MKNIDDLKEELNEALEEAADYSARDELTMAAIEMARADMIADEIQEQLKAGGK